MADWWSSIVFCFCSRAIGASATSHILIHIGGGISGCIWRGSFDFLYLSLP
jgi:hypothetical protein